MVQYGSLWFNIAQCGLIWFKIVQYGPNSLVVGATAVGVTAVRNKLEF